MRAAPKLFLAEREGFEPPNPFGSTVFKTAAIDHSAIFPFKSACKGTTNIWNTQGFEQKNANLFEFWGSKPCYSHKCATVASKGSLLG